MAYDSRRQRAKQLQLPIALVGIGVGLGAAAAVAFACRSWRSALDAQVWLESTDGLGRIKDPGSLLKQIAEKGLDASIRGEVWPFLLGVFPLTSTEHDRHVLIAQLRTAYQELLEQCQDLESGLADALALAQSSTSTSTSPTHAQQPSLPPHLVQFGEAHRIIVLDAVRTDFKHRGSSSSSTAFAASPSPSSASSFSPPTHPVTSALQGAARLVNGWASSHFGPNPPAQHAQHGGSLQAGGGSGSGGVDERAAGAMSGEEEPEGVGVWCSKLAQQSLDGNSHLDRYRRRQARRLAALLSAYAVYDPETGYCQGMSDLAAPFLVLMEDDALAFWCFAALMARARGNFATDESGMWHQLRALGGVLERYDRPLHHRLRQLGAVECHFAYRMMVVMLRREMSMDKAMLMWEVIWADALLSQLSRQSRTATDTLPAPIPLPGTQQTGLGARALYRFPSVAAEVSQSAAVGEDGEWSLFLYVVAAVVCMHRRQVLDDCRDCDSVLQLFASVRVDVRAALGRGRKMREAMQAAAGSSGSSAPADFR